MKGNLSMYPYANLAPLREMGEPEGFDFIIQNPKESADSIMRGFTSAAPVPVGALPGLVDQLEFPGRYGVAASEKVGSVLLFSNIEFFRLDRNSRIFLSDQSATSVLLLYVLLREKESVPAVTNSRDEADAVLVIGDDALIYRDAPRFTYRFDLVTLWHEKFNKPFVFARWAVRKDLEPALKENIRKWLSRLDTRDEELVLASAGLESRRLGTSRDEMISYLKGMRRVLTPEDVEGQELFLKKAAPLMEDFKKWRKDAAPGHRAGKRPGMKECLEYLMDVPLGELMQSAHEERMRRHPGRIVTYVMDTNPNYTNICSVECSFCAFHRKADDVSAYTLSPDELAEKVFNSEKKGANTVLLQGGLNPEVRLKDAVAYIRAVRKRCPDIHLHPFSPAEIGYLAGLENKPVEFILKTFWDEGVHTIPGGGAEVLSDRVRKAISPKKISSGEWIDIMETAHRIGFQTTATMMYGHIETPEDIAGHLLRLRDSQDRTGGYRSFIGWSYKPGGTRLAREKNFRPAHPSFYVRLIAAARLILDNFEHIQSSWFSESENAGCLGLMAGANDFGGILVEENVHKSAGHERITTLDRVHELIRQSGFTPALRDSFYRVRKVIDDAAE